MLCRILSTTRTTGKVYEDFVREYDWPQGAVEEKEQGESGSSSLLLFSYYFAVHTHVLCVFVP